MRIPDHILKTKLGLYSMRDMAIMLHINEGTIKRRINCGALPAPKVQLHGPRLYFSPDQAEVIKQHFEKGVRLKEAQGLWSMDRMAEALGISPGQLSDWCGAGRLDRPTVKVGERFYYRPREARKLKRQMKQQNPAKSKGQDWQAKEALGLYTISGASRKLGIPLITLNSWLSKGWLPKPSHQEGVYLFYTAEEVDQLWEMMKAKHYRPILESVRRKLDS